MSIIAEKLLSGSKRF